MTDEREFTLDDAFYQPVSPDDPAGPDLRRDEDHHAFRQLCTPRPERYDPIAGKELPAEPARWKEALPAGRALLARTKDATVLALVAQAELAVNGLPGLAGALDLMRATLKDHWQAMHPRADEDDDYWERAAVFRALNGVNMLARPIEQAALHVSPAVGPLSWRTLAIAAGELDAKKNEIALGEDNLRQLLAEEKGGAESFARAWRAAGAAKALLGEIETIVSEAEGSERISLAAPVGALEKLEAALAPYADAAAAPIEDAAADAAGEDAAAPNRARPGQIADRDEAVALMNAVIAYYARSARSSPVPFILIRVRDLLDKSFSEVLDEVAPGDWADAALKIDGMSAELLGAAPDSPAPGDRSAPRTGAAAGEAMSDAAARVAAAVEAIATAAAAPDAPAAPPDGASEGDAGDRIAPPAPPDLAPLIAEAREAVAALEAVATAPAGAASPGDAPGAESPGGIDGRAEVKDALERLARFFEANDPNSLAPAFLRRARPLVDQSFLDIIKELAPKGAGSAKLLLHRE